MEEFGGVLTKDGLEENGVLTKDGPGLEKEVLGVVGLIFCPFPPF